MPAQMHPALAKRAKTWGRKVARLQCDTMLQTAGATTFWNDHGSENSLDTHMKQLCESIRWKSGGNLLPPCFLEPWHFWPLTSSCRKRSWLKASAVNLWIKNLVSSWSCSIGSPHAVNQAMPAAHVTTYLRLVWLFLLTLVSNVGTHKKYMFDYFILSRHNCNAIARCQLSVRTKIFGSMLSGPAPDLVGAAPANLNARSKDLKKLKNPNASQRSRARCSNLLLCLFYLSLSAPLLLVSTPASNEAIAFRRIHQWTLNHARPKRFRTLLTGHSITTQNTTFFLHFIE